MVTEFVILTKLLIRGNANLSNANAVPTWLFSKSFYDGVFKSTFVLKVSPQFDFFASIISNKFCEKPNLPSIHCNILAHLCNLCM